MGVSKPPFLKIIPKSYCKWTVKQQMQNGLRIFFTEIAFIVLYNTYFGKPVLCEHSIMNDFKLKHAQFNFLGYWLVHGKFWLAHNTQYHSCLEMFYLYRSVGDSLRDRPLEKWWGGGGGGSGENTKKNSCKPKCPKKFLQAETEEKNSCRRRFGDFNLLLQKEKELL